MASHSISRSRLIARVELRRSLRAVWGNTTQLVALGAMGVLFLLPMVVGGWLGARAAGEALAAGTTDFAGLSVAAGVRGAFALVWLGLAALTVMRAVGATATVDEADGLLTTVPVRAVVGGILLAEGVRIGVWLAVPLVAVVGGFAVGAGTPLPVVAASIAVLAVLATALPAGYVVGLWIRQALTGYETIARHRTKLAVLAAVAYFGLFATGEFETVTTVLFGALQESPMGWLGDVALAGAPGIEASVWRVVAGLGIAAVAAPLLFRGAVHSATVHWFADPARPTETRTETATAASTTGRTDRLLAPVARPTRAITRVTWLRARRAPIKLLYAAYPLFGLVGIGPEILQSGIPWYLPYLAAGYLVWASGVLVTLNPLGDQGPVFPATLTAPVTGGQFVRGHVLAGVLVGLPLSILVVAPVALLTLDPVAALALTVATGAGVLAAPVLAVGVGVAVPRFGAVKVTGSRTAVVPSKTAFFAYTLVLGSAVVAGLLAFEPELTATVATVVSALIAFLTPISPSISPAGLRAFAGAVLVATLVSPLVAYRYATDRFDRFTIDP